MLKVELLHSRYGRIEALHGVSIDVAAGEIVTVVGSNGAGKTTLMRAISGLQPMTSGGIAFDGEPIGMLPAHRRLRRGIAQVPEGRQVFGPLTVEDNLRLGAWSRDRTERAASLDDVYALFPVLAEKRTAQAGTLSGGQQQMLAIGRALMSKPRLLLLDEPSMGLAPILVDVIFELLVTLRERGLTLLVVEQNAHAALSVADRGYVIETGRVVASADARSLMDDPVVRKAYLGL